MDIDCHMNQGGVKDPLDPLCMNQVVRFVCDEMTVHVYDTLLILHWTS